MMWGYMPVAPLGIIAPDVDIQARAMTLPYGTTPSSDWVLS
jgi:hypothetical protein